MKPKKNTDNPYYSIPLKDLQDLILNFMDTGFTPTKKRIDNIIRVLTSKTN